ncbi:benzaldehyde dehydrogenase [Sphingomonas sp. SRS2]|uniref:benzaldehyde dehydrogenase n=1 Tax=Sphingomonas sp. SRS2 TaxID=133190 RepID=UPI0006184B63|nr:benzaldehyde dehydrogenase [Sphingomonas sp. SRS2]KKC26027.1 benzaldehyde dehydrogenase [Sphingomonas sp. SRS2]
MTEVAKISHSTTSLAPLELWEGNMFSLGWRAGETGSQSVIEKATGESLGNVAIASVTDVARAAEAAVHAQAVWAAVPGPSRGDVLRRFSDLMLQHGDEIADWIVRESGSIRGKGQWEVHTSAREVLEAAALGSQPIGTLLASADGDRRSIARRIPIGVVGVITPWNSPFLLACRALGPALATGNAVILKPDPQTPVCGGVLLARLLEMAGLPDGLFHVLPGGVETGEALVVDPLVRMISFTGSTRAGRRVGAMAGEQLKRVNLELGGNNAFVVLEDADLDRATSAGAWGAFFHQGQICLTAGRHLVHESVAAAYAERLAVRADRMVVGDPFRGEVHLGPLVNERQAENVDRIVAETLAQGATLIAGGTRNGLFFRPTVLAGVRPGMPAFEEEIFGPVAPIITFSTDDEAVALANQTAYGLVASIVSANEARARRLADRIHVGIIHINDQTVLHEVYGPIGGVGSSGNGGNYGTGVNADQFTEWQWVTTRDTVPAYPF